MVLELTDLRLHEPGRAFWGVSTFRRTLLERVVLVYRIDNHLTGGMGAIHIFHLRQTIRHHAIERRVCVGVELLTFKGLIHIHAEREHRLAVHNRATLAIHTNLRQFPHLSAGELA